MASKEGNIKKPQMHFEKPCRTEAIYPVHVLV